MKKHKRYLLAILIVASSTAHAATTKVFETTCGVSKFRVTAVNNGFPLDNTFTLAAVTSSGARELFKGEEGGGSMPLA